MSVPTRLRRPFVILGVVMSLLLGAASIQAAAVWTASSAPLANKPASVEQLAAELSLERERSRVLQANLDQLHAGWVELAAALAQARGQIAADTAQAQGLQGRLAAAKAKLAALEASAGATQAGAGRTSRTTMTTASSAGSRDDHEDGEPDDD